MRTRQIYSSVKHGESVPVLTSFFGGDDYYHKAGQQLIQRCQELGISADIHEVFRENNETWADICLKKISFMRDQLITHRRPVFWCDIDTIIVKLGTHFVNNATADITIFLRNFHYILQFDHYNFSRTFHPGYVIYNYNEKVLDLLDRMTQIAQASNGDITDDFVLHEALYNSQQQYSFQLMPPSLIAKSRAGVTSETVFIHGDSGNVAEFKTKVRQHKDNLVKEKRKAAVLLDLSRELNEGRRMRESAIIAREVLTHDPNNIAAFTRLIRNLRALKETAELDEALQAGRLQPALAPAAYTFDYERAAKFGHFKRAKEVMKDVLKHAPAAAIAEVRSMAYNYGFDERARSLGVSDDARSRMWWWQRPFPGNWGDIIGPYIVEQLTGVPPKLVKSGPRLFSVGSIISWADDAATVWGSGSPRRDVSLSKSASYRAVRGPITRALVESTGANCPAIFGDPGLILPHVYTPKSTLPNKRSKLGLILHHNHSAEHLRVSADVKLINIIRIGFEEIETFIDEVTSCDAILSTSLHGLIVAHAYGVPTRWCDFVSEAHGKVPGDKMKFADYFLSVGMSGDRTPLNLLAFEQIDDHLASLCDELPRSLDLEPLLNAAPFEIRERSNWVRNKA